MTFQFDAVQVDGFRDEHAVYARHPASGNDSALLAVFNAASAAQAFAELMRRLQSLSYPAVARSGAPG